MTDWQPIETAPKDGTAVLVTSAGFGMLVRVGCFVPVNLRREVDPKEEAWWMTLSNGRLDALAAPVVTGMRPTYWQPLPDPPQ